MSQSLRCPQVHRRCQSVWLVALCLISLLFVRPAGAAQAVGEPLLAGPVVEQGSAASAIACANARKLPSNTSADDDAEQLAALRVCGSRADSSAFAHRPGVPALAHGPSQRYLLPPFRAPPVR